MYKITTWFHSRPPKHPTLDTDYKPCFDITPPEHTKSSYHKICLAFQLLVAHGQTLYPDIDRPIVIIGCDALVYLGRWGNHHDHHVLLLHLKVV